MRLITFTLLLWIPLFASDQYPVKITAEDRQDVKFIVETLANTSMAGLLFKQKALRAAGDRVRPLHTLQFLQCIFSSEQLKLDMRKIKKKSIIWNNHLMKGIKQGLNHAAEEGALTPAHVDQFADAVKVDPEEIYPLIQAHEWDRFVDYLLDH